MEKDLQVVGFRIGNETFGVRIASVREIVRVPEITSVPSAPETVEGVINLRGKIIPVMDLRKRFGHVDIQPDKKNRILVVELDNKLIGLIVNAASEVLKIPPSDIEAPGSVFAEGESNYVTGVGKAERTADHFVGRQQIVAPAGSQKTRGGRGHSGYREVALGPALPACQPADGSPHAPTMGTITAQIQLTEAELKLLQTLVYQECGMFFDERRSHFLKDRLAAPPESLPDGFFLQLLSPVDQPRREERAGAAAGESDRQRDELFPQSSAARPAAKRRPGRNSEEETGTPRLEHRGCGARVVRPGRKRTPWRF